MLYLILVRCKDSKPVYGYEVPGLISYIHEYGSQSVKTLTRVIRPRLDCEGRGEYTRAEVDGTRTSNHRHSVTEITASFKLWRLRHLACKFQS